MALDPVRNFARVTLLAGIDASATTITLISGDGAKLPNPATEGQFNLVMYNYALYKDPVNDPNREIVRCTARTGDVLTVTRAQEGTSATDHSTEAVSSAKISFTKKIADDIRGLLPCSFRFSGSLPVTIPGNGISYMAGFDMMALSRVSTVLTTVDVLYAIPAFELKGRTIDKVSVLKGSISANNGKAAIFYDNGSLYPGAKFVDLGAAVVSGNAAGWFGFTASPLPVTFPATGVYWYTIKFSASTNMGYTPTDSTLFGFYDDQTLNNAILKFNGYSSSSVYATAIPSVFGAGAALLTTSLPALLRRYTTS